MTVVLDSNVVVGELDKFRLEGTRSWSSRWMELGEDLHAPNLFTYELASAITQMEAAGSIPSGDGRLVWELADELDLTYHPPSDQMALVTIAHSLRRRSAYDAAYIELAIALNAELWTVDGKLARNAESVGFPVRLVV